MANENWEKYIVNNTDEWEQYAVKDDFEQYATPQSAFQGFAGKIAPQVSSGVTKALQLSNLPVQKSLELEAQGQELLDTKTHPQFPFAVNAPLQVAKDFGALKPSTYLTGMLAGYGASKIPARLPKLMTDKWVTQRAKGVKSAVDTTITGLKNQYSRLFKPYLNKQVKANQVKGMLKDIPKALKKQLGIKANKDITVGELWDIRNTLLKEISEGTWTKSELLQKLRIKEEHLTGAVRALKKVVLNNVDEGTATAIKNLDPQYTKAFKLGRKLLKTVYDPKSDSYKTTSLIKMFQDPTKAGAREAFREFTKFHGSLKQIEKDMAKYAFRQRAKKAVSGGLIGYGIYDIARRVLRRTSGGEQ